MGETKLVERLRERADEFVGISDTRGLLREAADAIERAEEEWTPLEIRLKSELADAVAEIERARAARPAAIDREAVGKAVYAEWEVHIAAGMRQAYPAWSSMQEQSREVYRCIGEAAARADREASP